MGSRLLVGIHLKVLVGEGARDSLDQNESEVKLSVMDDQSLAQGAKELFAPEGPTGATQNVFYNAYCFLQQELEAALNLYKQSGSLDQETSRL